MISSVDYNAIVGRAPSQTDTAVVAHLESVLPDVWCEEYTRFNRTDPHIYQFSESGVQFLFDFASEGQANVTGRSPDDRLIAAFGRTDSAGAVPSDNVHKQIMKNFPSPQGRRRRPYDRGHAAAREQGGMYGPNLFPMHRLLNQVRTNVDKGRIWRRMETIAANNPGMFRFARLIYRPYPTAGTARLAHTTWKPDYVEYGILQSSPNGPRLEVQRLTN